MTLLLQEYFHVGLGYQFVADAALASEQGGRAEAESKLYLGTDGLSPTGTAVARKVLHLAYQPYGRRLAVCRLQGLEPCQRRG